MASSVQNSVAAAGLGVEPAAVPSANRLRETLRRAERHARRAELWSRLTQSVAWAAAAVAAAIFADAVWGLPVWGLVAVDAALLTGAAWMAVGCVRLAVAKPRDLRHSAMAIERSTEGGSGRLIHALEFGWSDEVGGRSGSSAATSPALRALVVARGETAADSVDPRVLVDRKRRRRNTAGLILVAVVLGGLALMYPRVVAAGGARLLAPRSDLPSYTPVRFEVSVVPEVVAAGGSAVIDVTLRHPSADGQQLPTTANLVWARTGPAGGQTVKAARPMERLRHAQDEPVLTVTDALFSTRFEQVRTPIRFYIDTPAGRSKWFTVTPDTAPRFKSLHATVTPPRYTGLAPRTHRLDHRLESLAHDDRRNVLRMLPGSVVTLTAQSNVGLAATVLTADGSHATAQRQANPLSGDRIAEATFEPAQAGAFHLGLESGGGQASRRQAVWRIEMLVDRPPSVEVTQPEPIAIAAEGYPVAIDLRAKDDVGIGSLTLHPAVTPNASVPIGLALPGPASRSVNVSHELQPADYGAGPGDTLRFFAAARDNLPTAYGGPPDDLGQLSESPVFAVQIVTREQWNELARTRYGLDEIQSENAAYRTQLAELAEERNAVLDQLEALRARAAAGELLNDAQRQQANDLAYRLWSFAGRTQELADAMNDRAEAAPLYRFEEPFNDRLRALAAQLAEAAQRAEQTADTAEGLALPGVTPTQLAAFDQQADAWAQESPPFDAQTPARWDAMEEDLVKLGLAEEIVFHAERLRAVIVEQRELEQKLGVMRGRWPDTPSETSTAGHWTAEDRQRLETYGQREAALRDELSDAALMLEETADLAAPLLPRFSGSVHQMIERVETLGIEADLAAAAQHVAQQALPAAHASAEDAADKLESLLSEVRGVPGRAVSDLDDVLTLPKAGLESAIEQLRQGRNLGGLTGLGSPGQSMGAGGKAWGSAQATLIGPRRLPRSDHRSAEGSSAGVGPNGGSGDGAAASDGLDPAETLTPDAAATRTRPGLVLPGVPARYRETATAYFRRLADDADRRE
ncbi:MAG: hypothetical protein AAGG38_00800 [Planctomycetota bacterium]